MADPIDTDAIRAAIAGRSRGSTVKYVERLCDEIDRLRAELDLCAGERDVLADLVLALVAVDTHDEDGDCVYCRSYIADDEPHQPACPWARARAEVLPHRVRNGEVEHDTGPSGCCPKDGMGEQIGTEMPSSPPHERWCWYYRSCGDQPCDCGAVSPKDGEHG